MARPFWLEVSYEDIKSQVRSMYNSKPTPRRYWLEDFIARAWITYRQRSYIQESNRASKNTIAKMYVAWIKFTDDIVNSVQDEIKKIQSSK